MSARFLAFVAAILLLALPAGTRLTAGAGGAGVQTAAAPSAPRLSTEWKRLRSPHFVIAGNATERQLRDAIVELERFHQVIVTLFPTVMFEPAVPRTFVLFKHDRAFRPFKPRDARGRIQDGVAGYFSMHPDVIYMVAGVIDEPITTSGVILHEYAHYVIRRSRRAVPAWVDEGLAEFYSTFRTDREGRAVLGAVPPWRARTLREPLLSFDRLFTIAGAARAFQSDIERQRFYAQAWALVHYAMVGDRAGQLAAYLRALDRGLSPEDAFQQAFDVSFGALQAELRAYLRRLHLPALAIELGEDRTTEIGPAEQMTEADALQLQGDLLVRRGQTDAAADMIAQVLRLDPAHRAARVSLAAVQRARGDTAAAAAMLQAVLSETPDDFAALYWLGLDLATESRYDEARPALERAVAVNDRSGEAWLELSVLAALLGDVPGAGAALSQALTIHPDPMWYHRRAHRLFASGRDAEVVGDAVSYVNEAGWGNERSPYMAFLGALTAWRQQDSATAVALLAQTAATVDPSSWTGAVTAYLQGTLTEQALLRRARGAGEQTEARAYIGLKAAVESRTRDALPHLHWVRDRGSRTYTEYGLVLRELHRIEAGELSHR